MTMTDATKTATEIIKLDSQYPAARWLVKVGDEGDYVGHATSPKEALEKLFRDWRTTQEQLWSDYGPDIEVGMLTEQAIFLRHLDMLVQLGVPVGSASGVFASLEQALNEALLEVPHDEAWYGFTPVYDVDEDGTFIIVSRPDKKAEAQQ